MHSYKEPEVVVKYLDIIKYHIGYVKVWNEAGWAAGLGLRLLFRYVYVYVLSCLTETAYVRLISS